MTWSIEKLLRRNLEINNLEDKLKADFKIYIVTFSA